MPTPIHSAVEDHFRTPEDFFNFNLLDELGSAAAFFHCGGEVTAYGSLSERVLRSTPGATLHDTLEDVQFQGPCCLLPFNPSEVAANLRMERYPIESLHNGLANPFFRSVYYTLRPLLPVSLRKHAQRTALRNRQQQAFPAWPIDRSVDRFFERLLALALKACNVRAVPFIWFWPEGAPAAIVMTHDVETAAGLSACDGLMELDASHGIASSFQLIPGGRYRVSSPRIASIRARGFEVNVHDWNHDGLLFSSREQFLSRAGHINRVAAEWQAKGFRSAALYRNSDWISSLDFAYDMSFPSTARLDPQPGGCCTLMPWFNGTVVEIPLTATQDYSLFHILNQYSIDLWRQQTEMILQHHGLVSFIVHPDYICSPRTRHVYTQLLEYLTRQRADSGAWVALPDDVNRWWRDRSQMRLVRNDHHWLIDGPGSERARIAYAHLDGDRIQYTLVPSTEPVPFALCGDAYSYGGKSRA